MLRVSPPVRAADSIAVRKASSRTSSARASRRSFFGVCAVLFAVAAAATVGECASMAAMGGMPMPGGWALSMMWTPMCGQTWLGAATCFAGMWFAMMVAMMLPALAPTLWAYREAVGARVGARAGRLTALMGLGYFAVWTALGIAAFALGALMTSAVLRYAALARAVPLALGAVVLIGGLAQFSARKARHLAYCRTPPERDWRLPANAGGACRHGVRLGLHCVEGCANLTAILFAVGIMDLWAMALVTTAITAERLAANGTYIARVAGAAAIGAGLSLIAQAALRAA